VTIKFQNKNSKKWIKKLKIINLNESPINHNILDKDFKSILEIVNTLKECQIKDHHSKLYNLFSLFCWIAKNIKFEEKSESKQECGTVFNR